ncbi:phage tail spike protein, partial [Streptosporangium roseum]|uniref:phage tail spike protein n=1 Tax=Streptosporangium roseum TaxID=2001 RepID=UPI0033178973
AIKDLQELAADFKFSIEITLNNITKKIINCYNQIGKITNKRFEYGEEVLKIVHQQDRTNIVTALIGRGKGEEVGDGYGRRIEFSDVEWKKSNGKLLDKPKGQNWIEYPEMTKEYGIPSNGKMLPRKTVVVFDDVEGASELLQKTYDQLAYYCRPLVQFSTEILGSDSIGNTVSIHRGNRNYHYQTRVFKVVTDYVNGRVQASLGDNLSGNSINRQLSQVQSNISDLDNNKMTWYDSTEIGKYQSDIIRGAKGGSIMMMNPSDLGKRESREPFQMVWMNGPSIEESDHFLVANSEGIGFIDGNFNLDNFKTAWTIDGIFNADFINAGTLQGVKIRSVHHDFIIELDQGKIRFIKKDGSSEKEMFAFAPTYVGGQLQGINAIQNQGYSFALSSKGNNGALLNVLEIPKDSTAENRKLNLYGEVKVKGNFYVNDVKIDTNGGGNSGGGGGWNGQYPPEVTSDRDKRYWQIWAMAIGSGFSKQAAAALLGNAQGESDANPTADEGGGRPGFGYGVWQWTDSSGASSGRVYMINLMTRAGVTDNPDTITAQFKLLMWHSPNGQWIATSSYPYSWTQFMTLTNINTATQAFVANFERPLNGHPERSTWAQEWYNKFVNLEIPSGGGGYIAPISSPITVTSEMGWRTSPITGAQEFHNAMDLVNGNPTTPILASNDGQVVQAGSNYYDWYGNYTVIKHADGLYTGYAHQSRIDVSVGQNVKKGQQIGLMGATGPVTGPHLHFQFMDQYWPSSSAHFKNPRDYIKF